MIGRVISLRWFFVVAAIPLVVIAMFAMSPPRSGAVQQQPASPQEFGALLRRGVGSEVTFAGAQASAGDIRRSVEMVASFIRRRSGLELSGSVVERLIGMETSTLNGKRRRSTVNELAGALSDTLLERVATLSDADVEQVANTLGAFRAPDLPAALRGSLDNVRLRANQLTGQSHDRFVGQLRALRDGDAVVRLLAGTARAAVADELRRQVDSLGQALPEQWRDAPAVGLSPLQGLLLSYSTTSDDYLWYSETELKWLMRSVQTTMAKRYGHYPVADGRFAYGVNGYLYSSPLDMAFSGHTLDRLLDRLEERSAK